MMSMQETLKRFYKLFLDLPVDVTHFRRVGQKPPFLIWSEQGEDSSFHTENRTDIQQLMGVIDYFTKREFDPVADMVQEILDGDNKIGWSLESVQYEDETNIIHYTWRWWLNG